MSNPTTIFTVAATNTFDEGEQKTFCDVKTSLVEFGTDGVPMTDTTKLIPYVVASLLADHDEFNRLANMYLEKLADAHEQATEDTGSSDVSGSEA